MMLTDVIPMVERTFRVAPGCENRAMAGLSMGGMQTFVTALANLDKFGDQLAKAGINHIYFESPGTDHEWLTWRRCLRDFAPRLFR